MIGYPRYEEVEIPRAVDAPVDVAKMMREAQEKVERASLRREEQVSAVEPWGVEFRAASQGTTDTSDTTFRRHSVYRYRVTVTLLPAIGATEFV